MLISVVIPLFNKNKYILRAINSVLTQTYQNFEIIVVDDGSTDDGPSIVESIKDDRITLIRQENSGVSVARNTGVQQARAEWVAFLDADDEYLPDFFEHVIRFLGSNTPKTISFVGANYYINNKSRPAQNMTLESGIYDYFELFREQRSPNNSSTTVVNKEIYIRVGGCPVGVKQFEDWCAWIKLAFVGGFGYIRTPGGVYHYVPESVSRSPRSSAELYSDALMVPKTVTDCLEVVLPGPARIKSVRRFLNEYVINTAIVFSRQNTKAMAIQCLRFYDVRYLRFRDFGRFFRLAVQLIVPGRVKAFYRALKSPWISG